LRFWIVPLAASPGHLNMAGLSVWPRDILIALIPMEASPK